MTQHGAGVELEAVSVRYPGAATYAVDGVSLRIAPGELTVLLGPSGCGKSTLLRTLNRLVELDAGTARIDGTDVRESDPVALRRRIGYAIQATGLFPHMRVAENIATVPRLLGWDRARIAARVDELLELVQLAPERYRARFPRELSGGEQQRVGVARALAAEPPLLLMDEPFGAVDAIVRRALQDEITFIHDALGTTIVFVTHDVEEALRIADRIVVMSAGRVLQTDTPLRVLAQPADAYVASLLDSDDAVRRLGLMCAADAARDEPPPADAIPVEASDSLRTVLNGLLLGSGAAVVLRDGRAIGTIAFNDVRRALGSQP